MTGPLFLFSVDLEDPEGERFASRAAALTELYLDFLREAGATATFFVVGEVARREPALVRRIAAEGHEIACHSDQHIPLDRQDSRAFRDDLSRSLEALAAAGAPSVKGYRAPCFSLTARTRWAYDVLAELGFLYSSSVLPARNPLYGWPGFGRAPKIMSGVIELPITLLPWPLPPLPMGGGVYFRVLPGPLLRAAFRARRRTSEPVLGYFHPYDIDQERRGFAHPGFRRHSLANWLLQWNRGAVMPRLREMLALGYRIEPYRDHAERLRAGGCLERHI